MVAASKEAGRWADWEEQLKPFNLIQFALCLDGRLGHTINTPSAHTSQPRFSVGGEGRTWGSEAG